MDKPIILHSGESLLEVNQSHNAFRLLLERDDLSVIANHVAAQSLIWLTPNREQPRFEFYLLLSGRLSMRLGDREETLCAGDSFYFDSLSEDVLLTPMEDTDFLCVSTRPMFSDVTRLVDDMNTLNDQIERKDHYTAGHCKRAMGYANALSQRLELSESRRHSLMLAALYHDVGKCFVPSAVLNKPGRLTDEEFALVREHSAKGEALLKAHFPPEVTQIVRSHHERLDGSGYPDGLKGDQLSMEARILAVSDVFDAMTTDRPYKKAKTNEAAVAEFEGLTQQYDADVITVLKALCQEGTLSSIQRHDIGGAAGASSSDSPTAIA